MNHPPVLNPAKGGSYPASAKSGGGFVWDAGLEYRVWCHPERGALDVAEGCDYYLAFGSLEEALAFSHATAGAEEPLALVQQREYIDEPESGQYGHVREPRITEWPLALLLRPRRDTLTIPEFMAADARAHRLDVLRGLLPRPLAAPLRGAGPSQGDFDGGG